MKITLEQPLFFQGQGRREYQEDRYKISESGRYFIVCDGMGGHQDGDIAAQTVCNALATYFDVKPPENYVITTEYFDKAVMFAYDELDKNDRNPLSLKGMGTTMTCVYFGDNGALIAHTGDSRIYQIRAKYYMPYNYKTSVVLETKDHSLVQRLVDKGEITKEEAKKHQTDVTNYKIKIKETEALVKKYEEQQNNVRNNREYDSLTKEIEYQNLDIQLSEKRIREATAREEEVNVKIEQAQARLAELNTVLTEKKEELHSLVEGTEKEEEQLLQRSADCEKLVEDRLLVAYKRIRKNARNGLAVVGIFDEACGGCFNRIPPQHQLDICTHKKIIVCEYCGRILVDKGIIAQYNE